MIHSDDLKNWRTLNAALRNCNEEDCSALLALERRGEARLQFLTRIHGAFNKRRYERERLEITKQAKRS